MLPHFEIRITSTPSTFQRQDVNMAGIWDNPEPEGPAGTCRFRETTLTCIGLVNFCTEKFDCWDSNGNWYEDSKTPYPCGVCVGGPW